MLISAIWFIFFIFFFLILPAKIIFEILRIKKENDVVVDFGINLIFGLVFLVCIMIVMRLLRFPLYTVWLIPLLPLIYLFVNRIKLRELLHLPTYGKKYQLFIILFIIFVGILGQNIALFRGGWSTEKGLVFPSLHDNMWNIAITNELLYRFPPENPAISGEMLKNHHYFYMFFLSLAGYVTKAHVFDLYYRLGPILISLIYGLGLYSVTNIFTKKTWIKGLAVFLGYFSGNFAYLALLFLGPNFDWKGNTFLIDQPFDQIFNPYSVLGFGLLLFSIYSLYKAVSVEKKTNFGWSIVASMFIGTLYGFKSFGGLIAILALGFTSIFLFIKEKEIRPMKIMFFSLVFFLPVFFLITEPGEVSLHWFPGWILTEMMIGQDKLNLPFYAEVESYYMSIHNILGLLKIKFIELLIYFIGNLGTRLIGVFYLLKNFRIYINNIVHTYIICIITISLSIPLLFNLGGNAHNIVQFSPYALVLLSLYTGIATGEIYYFLYKKKHKIIGFLIVILVVMLSIPVNVKNILGKLAMPNDLISFEQMTVLNYLKNHTDVEDMLILNPKQFNNDPVYVAALSERKIYLASPGYARQAGKNSDDRIKNIDGLYGESIDVEFLKTNKIKHILLLKDLHYPDGYRHLIDGVKNHIFEIVFDNSEVILLKVT